MIFCLETGVTLDPLVGMTPFLLSCYATWMAQGPTGRHLLLPITVRNYISLGPRVYHLRHNLPWDEV